jgi:hypothetical protein
MTFAQAIEILTLWKAGAKHYTQATINQALYATGDLDA